MLVTEPGRGAPAAGPIRQIIPAAALARVKAALPRVQDPALVALLADSQTLWYDADVLKESYQDSVGASSNDHWPDLVAGDEQTIFGLHDRANHRWQFPFATTFGTDASTNLRVEHFVAFPQTEGHVQTVTINHEIRNADRPEWRWTYQPGTVFGEVLFVTDGTALLPTEIRVRTRTADGWATNAFRPFPRAADLAEAIKQLRPDWQSSPKLQAMISFLGNPSTLKPASLEAQAALAPTFSQSGYLDTLPDFQDDALVRTLLTTTPFKSAYLTAWKTDGDKTTFAASTTSRLSIVPTNYTGGLIEVSDDSCMRCHKETSRLVSDFYDALYLYGEIWGMDGIFSFHPYDETLYPQLRQEGGDVDGYADNRRLNAALRDMGIFTTSF